MDDNYKPPRHPQILLEPSNNAIWVHSPDSLSGFSLTPDEAAKLGLALMEHGIYMKGRVSE